MQIPSAFRLVAVLPILAATACDSTPTGPENIVVAVQANIQRPGVQPAFVVTRTGSELSIQGTFAATCLPTDLSGTAQREGSAIVVTITEADLECTPTVGDSNYNAIVSGLNSVPPNVRIIHSWAGDDRDDELVFQGTFD